MATATKTKKPDSNPGQKAQLAKTSKAKQPKAAEALQSEMQRMPPAEAPLKTTSNALSPMQAAATEDKKSMETETITIPRLANKKERMELIRLHTITSGIKELIAREESAREGLEISDPEYQGSTAAIFEYKRQLADIEYQRKMLLINIEFRKKMLATGGAKEEKPDSLSFLKTENNQVPEPLSLAKTSGKTGENTEDSSFPESDSGDVDTPGAKDLIIKEEKKEKEEESGSSFREDIIRFIDHHWQKNKGLSLDGSIGATFGVPKALDAELGVEVFRKEDAIVVRRRYLVKGGLDSSLGLRGGFFIGKGKTGSDGKRSGIGGKAGANVEAKLQTTGVQEFEFPFKEDLAILSLIRELAPKSTVMEMTLALFDLFTKSRLDPNQYLKKTKYTVGAFAKASAIVEGGMKKGTEDHAKRYKKDEYAPDEQAVPPGFFDMKKLMNMSLKWLISLQGLAGVETKYIETRKNEETGAMEPVVTEVDLSAELSSLKQFPLLDFLLALFPDGAGVKYTYRINRNDPQPEWKNVRKSFYTMSGQLDYYQGPGSETEIIVKEGTDLLQLLDTVQVIGGLNFDLKLFEQLTQDLKIKRRKMIGPDFGTAAKTDALRKIDRRLQKMNQGLDKGVHYQTYLTLAFKLSVNQRLRELITAIEKSVKLLGKQESPFQTIYKDIIEFTNSGAIPEYLKEVLEILFAPDVLEEATLRREFGTSVAAGGAAGAGAKVRLDLYGKASLIHEEDIKKELVSVLKKGKPQLMEFLKTFFLDVSFLA